MRNIPYQAVVDAVSQLCISACYDLNEEMIAAFERACSCESHEPAVELIEQLLENARIAREERLPLCQDTGFAVVFVEQGSRCHVEAGGDMPDATLDDAINDGVKAGYEKGLLRKSIVADPLVDRRNTQTNTPAVIHHRWVGGDKLKLTVMAKGGGCENKSVFRMFKPTAGVGEVADFIVETARVTGADACPPFVIGVGIGGTFEKACEISKYALLRPLDSHHENAFYADLEAELLERINGLGVGPGGLKGDTTALAVLIETFPCHIASLPVAINIECHSHRHKSITL
ncbi:MAG: fumarate hydratase [Sedimentisphaerales bacterium]|nr:fumarate hydratase [Sedimentisphaerales bacterium]